MVRVYIGWDARDSLAWEVARLSLLKHASGPVDIVPLMDWQLRARGLYWRAYHVDPRGQMWDARDGRAFSTGFSYTRFCIPIIEDFGDEPVVFADADMLWRGDVFELIDGLDGYGVACVKHRHEPVETVKMLGNIQSQYLRKNWSSLMVLRPSRCRQLTPYAVNNMTGAWLHQFCWTGDDEIIGLDPAWNWLEGYSDPNIDPRIVHFTRGTPDMSGYENSAYADEWRSYLSDGAPPLTAFAL